MALSRRILPALILAALLTAALFVVGASATPADQATPPAEPPQPAAGRGLYMANCAPCHGQTGKGDGPSAPGLSVPATAFADYNVIAGLSFTEMFSVTRNGRMARMMPPWSGRLTDQQIWNVVGYAWTLHTSPAEIAAGKAVYDQQCAACHGPAGKGQPATPDLSDFSRTAAVSQKAWAELLIAGRGAMPAYGARLTPTEQRAVLEYARSLSLGPLSAAPPITGTGVISGVVTNGSTGQPAANAAVELGIFDQTAQLDVRQTTADATGFYRFTGLPTDPTLVFVARVTGPGGFNYSSEPLQFTAGISALDAPVSIWETTADPAGVRADRVHFIVEFDGARAYFTELIVFSLDGDRAYVGDGKGTLRFTLPTGAEGLEISDGALGERYVATADGFVDTVPLPPGRGTRQTLYRYEIPYTTGSLDVVRTLPYPAANVNLLMPEGSGQATSEQLKDQTVRQTQTGNFISLSGRNVAADQPITLRFSGLPVGAGGGASVGAGETATPTNDRALLLILLGAGGLVIALLVGLPLLRRGAPAAAAAASEAELIDALARLDIAHQAGELSEPAYRDARLRLKAQLLALVRKEGRP